MKYPIPKNVQRSARVALYLKDDKGFQGGTETGWARARQLSYDDFIEDNDVATMRAWFARHGPDASNGGTSYPGYVRWIEDGMPTETWARNKYRGAVAWLLWGGTEAYQWIHNL